MRAFGYTRSMANEDKISLKAFDAPAPELGTHDLLVEVKAVSVNPVDTKVRANVPPGEETKILGWDASGIVKSIGSDVKLFQPGDEVFYAGAIDRPGTNSELHAVDERIVGRKPKSLSHAEAAALPLTTITAWELLFDRFGIEEGGGSGETLVVIGGAGGVGSIMIQLARQLTQLTIVATASRDKTRAWVQKMGAHHDINHHEDMPAQLRGLGLTATYVAGLTGTAQSFPAIVEMLEPQGKFGLIDDPGELDVSKLKNKAISLHWEFMFTRSLFETSDMIEQHRLLSRTADLVDEGRLVTTMKVDGGAMTAENLRQAYELQESGRAVGKTVLAW